MTTKIIITITMTEIRIMMMTMAGKDKIRQVLTDAQSI